jgi:hypothetical protein
MQAKKNTFRQLSESLQEEISSPEILLLGSFLCVLFLKHFCHIAVFNNKSPTVTATPALPDRPQLRKTRSPENVGRATFRTELEP